MTSLDEQLNEVPDRRALDRTAGARADEARAEDRRRPRDRRRVRRAPDRDRRPSRQLVHDRLEARDASSVVVKDAAGRVTGVGFALFAKFNPDTPGKLVDPRLLLRAHGARGLRPAQADRRARADAETAELARRILAEERAMAERLSLLFDRAVEASLRDQQPDDLGEQLNSYLTDAHAIEAQAIELLSKGAEIAGAGRPVRRIRGASRTRPMNTSGSSTSVYRREARRPSKIKDAALRLGRSELGRVLRRPAGHAREARRVRLRVRASRDRRVRAAAACRPPRRRH